MIIQNISRKGPYCISIFKRALRTTSSVETYNFNLDNKMHTNGPVKVINVKYEKKKRYLAILFQNGGLGNAPQKRYLTVSLMLQSILRFTYMNVTN